MARPVLSKQAMDALDEIKDENGFSSTDQAVRHLLRSEGYDV